MLKIFILGFLFGGISMTVVALSVATRQLREDVEDFMEWYNNQQP